MTVRRDSKKKLENGAGYFSITAEYEVIDNADRTGSSR